MDRTLLKTIRMARFIFLVGALAFLGEFRWMAGQSAVEQSRALLNAGKFEEAQKLLASFINEHPQDAEARALLGWSLLYLSKKAEAVSQLEEASRLAPHSPFIAKLLAKACIAVEQNLRAEPILTQLTATTPADPEAWSLLGRLYQDGSRFARALPALEKALQLNPLDVQAQTALAFTYLGLGRHDDALAAYRKAVALNRQRPQPLASVYASFAIFLLRLNRIEEAREQIKLAEAIDPTLDLVKSAKQILSARDKYLPGKASSARILPPPQFKEFAKEAGIDFVLENSPTAAKHQVETMPGGVAVLDYDQDGFMDLYFVNGALSPSLQRDGPKFWNRLYRNKRDGSFEDVTAGAGVQGEGYMMAAAAADYDHDGYPDLFVAGVNGNLLYHNNRNGTFTATTAKAGLDRPHPQYGRMWGIHGLWLDYDRDGWLDLFLVNYCRWNPQTEPFCGDPRTRQRTYCHPRFYGALPNQLFHNNQDGTFTDVSISAGISGHLGKGMGAAMADFDRDGWPDIFVANDTEPNFLFRNQGNGQFEEVAMSRGVALNQFGTTVSSMGTDFRDFDNDGWPDLFVTDLTHEGWMLFRNAAGHFEDIADSSRVGLLSLSYGGWSNAIADWNNDGWKDLFAATGHAMDNIASLERGDFAQSNLLFLNQGNGTFAEVSGTAGNDFREPKPHRGSAVADFNNDGRLDLAVTVLGERAQLFINTTPREGHWLLLQLKGQSSNRDGLGALLRLETPDGLVQWNHATQSVGFASSSDPRVHFGLGRNDLVRRLEIQWPSGKKQVLEKIQADQILLVEEP
jgi:tetratricopeptide (TPR) repeat protein